MNKITVNYTKNTLEITKSFEKKARAYGSDAYNELTAARKEFPNYRIVVKTSKSNNSLKGMDYDFMREYISKHDNADNAGEGKHMAEFEKLCASDLSYGEIKQWFVETYPVFKDFKTRAQWILAV